MRRPYPDRGVRFSRMSAAIFGIIGVIVGGVLNGVITSRIERSRVRRGARAAARLVYLELGECREGFVTYAIRCDAGAPHDRAMSELVSQLRDDVWRDRRGDLAIALDSRAWEAVTEAYYEIAFFLRPGQDDAKQMLLRTPGRPCKGASDFRDKMAKGMVALRCYSRDSVPQWLRTAGDADE